MIYYAIKDNSLLNDVSEDIKALEMSLQANGHMGYTVYSTEYEDFTPSNLRYKVDFTTGKVVLNPEYEAEQAEIARQKRIAEIKQELNKLDTKRIRAMCEPETRADGQTWLEYYNEQAFELRNELQKLEEN